MGLRELLGKPSAKKVTGAVIGEFRKIFPFYSPCGHLKQLSPVIYSQGGCECGCRPEFQFYYDKNKLTILPCMWNLLTEPLRSKRDIFVSNIKQKLHLGRVDLVMWEEQPPEYAEPYMRR